MSLLPVPKHCAMLSYNIYRARAGIDALTAKGILHVRLWYNTDVPSYEAIDIFATHLQAKGENVRRNQIRELADFIQMHSDPNIPIMLLGDFNINGSPDAQAQPDSEYTNMMQVLGTELSLHDIGRNLGGTNYDNDPKKHRQDRLDYIFTSPSLEISEVCIEEFPDDRWVTLSDHAAILANIVRSNKAWYLV